MRADTAEPARYACDALLGLPPSDTPPALVLRADGSMLLGSARGLRAISRAGCPLPLPGPLADRPIYALAQEGAWVYAIAGEGVWQSGDAGASWELRSPLASGAEISALLASGGTLYASHRAGLLVSVDRGATFEVFVAERPLTLLAVDSGLWAVARAAQAVGNRGYEILRADAPEGPWHSLLALNYFGGLTLDEAGAVWVGDAGGGLYRSLDRATFSELDSNVHPSCLEADGQRLYACSEDLPSQPAVLAGAAGAQDAVLQLDQVTELVECEGATSTCAAAWGEWQRDVLGIAQTPDSGTALADAGGTATRPPGALDGSLDAGSAPSDDAPAPARAQSDGCMLAPDGAGAGGFALLALLASLAHRGSARTSRRRQRGGT